MTRDEALETAERLLIEALEIIPVFPDEKTVYEVEALRQRVDMRASVAGALIQLAQAKGSAYTIAPYLRTTTTPVTSTGRCGHMHTVLLNGDRWLHVPTLSVCDDPPVTDGPIASVTEAP